MRKRFRIIAIILLIAIVGGLTWLAMRPREPIYEGKPISFWLNNCDPYKLINSDVTPGQLKADAAVLRLGTNAIPTLLRMLHERDSPMKDKLLGLLQKQKIITITNIPAWQKHIRAIHGFKILGETGSNAVPDLIAFYHQSTSPLFQGEVIVALGDIGPSAQDAVPLLIEASTNADFSRGFHSVNALVAIHSRLEIVIPVLINSLGSPENNVRNQAARGLERFGWQASNAVPALTELLRDWETSVRRSATNALKAIDPEAAAKAGVK